MAQDKKKKGYGEGNELLISKLERWWREDSDARKRMDWKWYVYDLFHQGHHYSKYDTNTQQIITSSRKDNKPRVIINKIASTVRGVTNYALRNRPKAEVTPADMSKDQVDEIVKQNTFLDYMHDSLGLRFKQHDAVEESLVSGISWLQIVWDEEADDGKGQIVIHDIDKYDLYWQASARTPKESRRYTLAIKRNVDDLKRDPKYKDFDWERFQGDSAPITSSLKEQLTNLEQGTNSYQSNNTNQTTVREFWYYGDKEMGEDENTIYICAMAGKQVIRQPEPTDLDRMPFFRLCTSRNKLAMVGKSWIRDLIPINKRLNSLMSSLAEFNIIMNKGYWIADKGAGVRTIMAEHGIILEKKRGFDLTQGQVQTLSAALYQEIDKLTQFFEDIGAFHDATAGRIPTGASSGRAIEALQVGDSNNLSEVVDNVELWLEEMYEYILSLSAQKYQFARTITPVSKTSQREFISVIGEDAENKPDNALVLKKKNVVDVKISSYLAHTPEARRDAIKDLATIVPDLDEQTILEVYEIGPIADVIKRIKQRREEKMQEQQQMAQNEAQASQPPKAGASQAIAVIRAVLSGQTPPNIKDAGPEFAQYFDQFLQSEEGQQLAQESPETMNELQQIRDKTVIVSR